MDPETNNPEAEPVVNEVPTIESIHPVNQVTTISKILTAVVFIALPFAGAYVGYKLTPEKSVEVDITTPIQEPVIDVTSENIVPDGILHYNGFHNEIANSGYYIKDNTLFYSDKNLNVKVQNSATAYTFELALIDGQMWYDGRVIESTNSFKEIGPWVFLTDTNIYQIRNNESGTGRNLHKRFSNVQASSLTVIPEFSDTTLSSYLHPVADGDYWPWWFKDTTSFYCMRSVKKLVMPVEVEFHTVSKVDYFEKPEITISGIDHLLWVQRNNNNTIGYVTFSETNTGKKYDSDCQQIMQ